MACDHDMRFVFVYAGWEGSAHDARVLQTALSNEDITFTMPLLDKYYVVDFAYKNMPGFMAPFRGIRYHLQDFSGRGRAPKNSKEYFNHIHSSLRNVIERTFGILKRKFAFLKGPMNNYDFKKQVNFVIAICVVHNFIKELQLEDDIINEFANEDLIMDEEVGSGGNFQSEVEEVDMSTPAIVQ
ncbi:OLC1v1024068C1 [Oldenlandia corymbosa var. corymbosa]|uniref:OLC1v1024068C1 n=1 Tax=Oldenlandia corymbosa var. corymbosa TaxID=529605 RepID=A0AAV1C490_OLDCO|nr:OLC1v1024068C1 [Oldenlandia corymbosa var. corymbosa]